MNALHAVCSENIITANSTFLSGDWLGLSKNDHFVPLIMYFFVVLAMFFDTRVLLHDEVPFK